MGNGFPEMPQIPFVPIGGAGIGVGRDPQGRPTIFVGPLVLAIPLEGDAARTIAAALSEAGIIVAGPGDLPPPPS